MQLAQQLEYWKQDSRNVSLLIISGPEELAPAYKAAAKQSWSLSPLILPHPLVRVLVAESYYRSLEYYNKSSFITENNR